MINQLKINSKKQVKLMEFFQTRAKKKITIILATLHLRMVVVVKVVLVVLVVLMDQISQIFLKIFLVTLAEAEEEVIEEVQATEDLI